MDWERVVEEICKFIKEYVDKSNANGVIIGLSGGIDSSTVAFLCKRALGEKKVLGLIMPEKGVTREEDVEDALSIADILGIEFKIIEINEILDALKRKLGEGNKIAEANLKPRIRMTINYYFANNMNRLVAGTGNKSELMIGYFTKYGDGGVDFLPIGDLYKTEVFKLAEYIGVPERIIKKKPTAGLWVNQTDEDEIGMSYEELDEILKAIENERRRGDDKFKRVEMLVKNSKHKREMPPIARVRHLL